MARKMRHDANAFWMCKICAAVTACGNDSLPYGCVKIGSRSNVQSRQSGMLAMFISVNCRVNSMEGNVTAMITMICSLHDNMTEMMKKTVPSVVVGNGQITFGRRPKGDTRRGRYLSVRTAGTLHLTTLSTRETCLLL